MRPTYRWIFPLAAAILVSTCGDARRSSPWAEATIPEESSQAAIGQRLFMRHCNQCHVDGAAGLGPAINDKPLPGWVIKAQVRKGLGAMPSFGEEKISDEEVDAVVAYLKVLRR